jgi:hypothetical protein
MSRAPLISIAAAACIVAPVTVVADLHSPVRVAAAFALFCLAPGVAVLPLLSPRRAGVELALVVGFSLATCALISQVMLWLDAWSPVGATCLLAAACLVSLAGQITEIGWRGAAGAER